MDIFDHFDTYVMVIREVRNFLWPLYSYYKDKKDKAIGGKQWHKNVIIMRF